MGATLPTKELMPAQAVGDLALVQDYFVRLKATIDKLDPAQFANAIGLMRQARDNEQQVITLGNGGSASTASHMIVDINKGLSYKLPRRFRAICLADSIATLSAYANDVSYEAVFVEPLKNYLQPGDLVIAISGSGNSKNVLAAVEYANANGGVTLGVTGFDGGKLRQMARHSVHVPIHDMQITEDLHLVMNHIFVRALGAC